MQEERKPGPNSEKMRLIINHMDNHLSVSRTVRRVAVTKTRTVVPITIQVNAIRRGHGFWATIIFIFMHFLKEKTVCFWSENSSTCQNTTQVHHMFFGQLIMPLLSYGGYLSRWAFHTTAFNPWLEICDRHQECVSLAPFETLESKSSISSYAHFVSCNFHGCVLTTERDSRNWIFVC